MESKTQANSANREFKDTMFSTLFSEPVTALGLYNALSQRD